jgi:hypothetical protein
VNDQTSSAPSSRHLPDAVLVFSDGDLDPAPAPARPDAAGPAWFTGTGSAEIAFDALDTSTLTSGSTGSAATPPGYRLFTFLTTTT